MHVSPARVGKGRTDARNILGSMGRWELNWPEGGDGVQKQIRQDVLELLARRVRFAKEGEERLQALMGEAEELPLSASERKELVRKLQVMSLDSTKDLLAMLDALSEEIEEEEFELPEGVRRFSE